MIPVKRILLVSLAVLLTAYLYQEYGSSSGLDTREKRGVIEKRYNNAPETVYSTRTDTVYNTIHDTITKKETVYETDYETKTETKTETEKDFVTLIETETTIETKTVTLPCPKDCLGPIKITKDIGDVDDASEAGKTFL
jgi:hypothetical protein